MGLSAVIVVVLVIFILGAVKSVGARVGGIKEMPELDAPNAKMEDGRYKPKYSYAVKKRVMTKPEEDFFRVLLQIFDSRFFVLPQVHLSTVLNHKIKGQRWQAAFSHINGKSVDFLLCERSTLRPVCAIELDDYTHNRDDRISRDAEVERIFAYAGLTLVRFSKYEVLTRREIFDRVVAGIRSG